MGFHSVREQSCASELLTVFAWTSLVHSSHTKFVFSAIDEAWNGVFDARNGFAIHPKHNTTRLSTPRSMPRLIAYGIHRSVPFSFFSIK